MHQLRWFAFGKALTWRRAFWETLVVLCLCIVVVGLFYIPHERQQPHFDPSLEIVSGGLSQDGKTLVALFGSPVFPDASSAKRLPGLRVKLRSERTSSGALHKNSALQLGLTAAGAQPILVAPSLTPTCVAVDTKGARIFVGDLLGSIFECSGMPSSRTIAQIGRVSLGHPHRLACSWNGKSLIASDICGLYAWNIDNGSNECLMLRWFRRENAITSVALDADSDTGLYVRNSEGHSELVEFQLASGACRTVIGPLAGVYMHLTLSLDGNRLAIVRDSGELALYERETRAAAWQASTFLLPKTGGTWLARLSADGSTLITTSEDCYQLVAWDVSRHSLLYRFERLATRQRDCVFIDPSHIVSWGEGAVVRVWSLNATSPTREIKVSL